MAARKRSTAIRREQIARAALDIVARDGVSSLDIAGVARRCGLVPSALYRHFRGRNGILDAVLDALAQRMRANVDAVRAETTDGLARLERLFRLHVAMGSGGAALPRFVFSDEVSAPGSSRRRRLRSILDDYVGRVAAIAADGAREGALRRELEPASAAVLFLGVAQLTAVRVHLGSSSDDAAAHIDRMWATLASALCGPAGRVPRPSSARRSHSNSRPRRRP